MKNAAPSSFGRSSIDDDDEENPDRNFKNGDNTLEVLWKLSLDRLASLFQQRDQSEA